MAANDPNPPVAGATRPKPTQPDPDASKPVLSVEEAELFASRIRPSWELIDEVAREDLAADLAGPPAGATPASDTVIDGVPTFAIGDEAPKAEDKKDDAPFDPKARAVLAKPEPEAPKPPARGGKTRIGMGNGADEAAPAAASSRRAVSTKPAPAKPAPAEIADDPIEIPVTGAPKGTLVKVGIGAVALIGVAVIGYGLLGGSKDTDTPAPTAAATAAAAPTAPATAQPPPRPTAEPPAATATAAPTASAKASAAPKEEPKPEPKRAEPKPEPKKAEPKPEPKKAAAPPPAKPRANPPPKKSGGIIRETPF